MLNKLPAFIRQYALIEPGDRVICAVSGGADSVALLVSLHLLREKLNICLQAAHFNHRLRGAESDRDEQFVRELCRCYNIELFVGTGEIKPGKKGLEAAAREARYAFFETLPGKIATAHTADDNAETVLMHLVRGSGLKGLGGIAPVRGKFIRPMLSVTRQEVLAFLEAYHLDYVTDTTNEEDVFFRNRLRHHIIPLLKRENPRLAENISATALRLREDEAVLENLAVSEDISVSRLQKFPAALRSRVLSAFLKKSGIKEPEAEHIALAERLVFSYNPSASASFPGGVEIGRNYDKLEKKESQEVILSQQLPCPGSITLENGLTVCCYPATELVSSPESFTVIPQGELVLRSRCSGDTITLPGGTKSLKKLFIDRKIPAAQRDSIPVLADDSGVLWVETVGFNQARRAQVLPGVTLSISRKIK